MFRRFERARPDRRRAGLFAASFTGVAAILAAAGCASGTVSTLGGAPAQTATSGGAHTQQAASGPSGQPMPVGDIPGWHQVFADDFNTNVPVGGFSGCDPATRSCSGLPSAVRSNWWAYPDGWKDTDQQGTYMPSKTISIANGMMRLNLHTENGVHMAAAPVPIIPGAIGSEGGQVYGKYEIRFLVDRPIPGYKLAWLLWPDSENFPGDGEIDFPEGDLDGFLGGYVHHMDGFGASDQDAYGTAVRMSSGWHTATIDWTAKSCVFYLDGMTVGTTTSRIPSTPMHWVLQSETDQPKGDSAAADILIDWVSVYRPSS
jgi:hypothetical protein